MYFVYCEGDFTEFENKEKLSQFLIEFEMQGNRVKDLTVIKGKEIEITVNYSVEVE